MLLAHEAWPGSFEVATVDHRLRAESAEEAAMVAALCAQRAIPHHTLVVEVPARGNLQAQAREARYAALAGWATQRRLAAVATAHHLDDHAETLLMRLVRGAGVRGLAAMRPRGALPGGSGVQLLRPLLGWRRAELSEVVSGAGLSPVADPGNADLRFERAAWRERLKHAPWLPPQQLAASARHLADADDALDWAAAREFAERVEPVAGGWIYRPLAPAAIRLRVLERLLGGEALQRRLRGPDLARLLETLERGGTATLAGTKATILRDGAWRFTPAPPPRAK